MYDLVVAGAGLAGQVVANYAAMRGRKVLLVEQNHHTGGNMSGFVRKGFYFDGGDQSFESLGVVFPILREVAGYGPDDFIKARYRMVSKDFDFFIDGPDSVEAALREGFPDEPGIRPLFDEVRDVEKFLVANYDPWDFPLLNEPSLASAWPLLRWLRKLRKWSTFRYRQKALEVIRHAGLRNWLTNVGYYRMPYLFFAGFWHIWSHDYWHPRGGMQTLHDRLANAFTGRGGDLRLNTLVKKINVDSAGRATGITTASGEMLESESIVWAGDYTHLIRDVLGPGYFPAAVRKRLFDARLTETLVSVYLGLDESDDELADQLGGAHHPFYFPNYEVIFPDSSSAADVHRRMWVALSHFGAESPAAPAGKSTLTLQTFSSHNWENFWHNGSDDVHRSERYRTFKNKVGMDLVGLAENLVPGLRNRIEFMDVGTPLSLHRFSRNWDGASGGWCYDGRESPVWRLGGLNRIRTPIPNLFCAGHYTLWPGGVISAALSGRIVGNLVTGRRGLAPVGR